MKAKLAHGSMALGAIPCRVRRGSCANKVLKDLSQSVSDFTMHFSK